MSNNGKKMKQQQQKRVKRSEITSKAIAYSQVNHAPLCAAHSLYTLVFKANSRPLIIATLRCNSTYEACMIMIVYTIIVINLRG